MKSQEKKSLVRASYSKNSLEQLRKFNQSEVTPVEWYSINRFVQELKSQKTDSSFISLYYPHGNDAQTIDLLKKTKRNETLEKIEAVIEKRIVKRRRSKKKGSKDRFINTHCIFGWHSNGKTILKEIGISKKLPFVYLAGKKPFVKPFRDILKSNYQVILVILDNKSAHIQHMQGDKVLAEKRLSINLQGRHKKGGQSQKRFLRARQTFIQGFFKRIAKKIENLDSNDVEILFIGGIGTAKIEFHDELNSELKKKCRFIEGISFGTNVNEQNKKIIKHLYDYRKKHVLEVTAKFESAVKEGLVLRNNSRIQKALERGAVDTLLVSANYYHSSPTNQKIIKMIELAKNASSVVEFVTNPRLVAKLADYDHVLALLRYKSR